MTVGWDDKLGLLEREKGHVSSVKDLQKFPTRCCGNSPGKQHTNNCEFDAPGYKNYIPGTRESSPNSMMKPKKKQVKTRLIKSAAKVRKTQIGTKGKSRPQSTTGLKKIRKRQ